MTRGASLEIDQKESINQKIDRFLEEGRKYYRQFEPDQDECEQFYEGVHWKNRDPQNRHKNYIFQQVESEIPLLMDPMPSTTPIVKDPQWEEKGAVLGPLKDHIYRQQNLFLKDIHAIREMLKVGQGYQYVDYDPDGEGGEGSVVVKNIMRNQVILDPAAEEIDQCRYAIITVPLSNEELKRRFPKTAKDALNQPLKDIYNFSGSKYYRENQNSGTSSGNNDTGRYESKDMTFLEEVWLRDYEMEDIPDDQTQIEITEESAQLMQGINPDITKWEDHEKHIEGHLEQKMFMAAEALGVPPEAVTPEDIERLKEDPEMGLLFQIIDDHLEMHKMHIENMDGDEVGKRPKYPKNLRRVIRTGKVIHEDGAPPVDLGIIPLAIFYCYKGNRIIADGIIKNMISMQKTINEIDHKEFKGLKLNANSGWRVDKQSGVDPDTLTDEDGIVVTAEQGTDVSRLQYGQVSPQLEARSRREYEAMQRVEGNGEVVFGEAPKHEASGVLYKRIQQQALGRIRLKSKMVEDAIYRRDLLLMAYAVKFYSTERMLRTEDMNGKVRFVKFDPRDIRDLPYEMILAPGTSAGNDAETISETYKELLMADKIDLKTYATITNLPKKQDLLDMLEAQDMVQAQLQDLQTQNLQLKAQFAPQLLTPEELALLEEQQNQQAVGNDQAQGM